MEPRADRRRLTTERKVQAGFAVALACLAAVGVISYLSVLRLNADAGWVARTREILTELEALLSATTDAETAERGYVITGARSYLAPYSQALDVASRIEGRLGELTADNPAQHARLAAVDALVAQRFADVRTVIELGAIQGFAAAQDAVMSGNGKRIQDRIRALVGEMKAEEATLLAARQRRTRRSSLVTEAVIVSGGALAFIFVGFASVALRRDFAGRARAEQQLREAAERLDSRVRERTAELARSNASLQAQLARLALLAEITRAIGERQDIRSIFQVVIRTLEDHLPLDFCAIGLYDTDARRLTVSGIGLRGEELARELALGEQSRIEVDENGLSRCLRGRLVYEPDVAAVDFPFPQRLARGGLSSLVAAPLLVESKVFGALLAARRAPHAFTSGECEFLRQVTEHVALASHQAELHSALQRAYDDLRQTQQAVMQQDRLLALGKMASGIAHDINNAISPVSLYTQSLLEREPGLSARARQYLETIQRSIDDVAETVARMREFYRPREPQVLLKPVGLNELVRQVLDLTRARWSDMAVAGGTPIEVRTELADDLPVVAGIEGELRDALTNLVFNALDAMPEGGALTLRTRAAARAPDEPPDSRGTVRLEVADTGAGMDEETRRRCLEPFFTTKGERGTGLGLAMVYGAMQRHGADIEIESAVGRGTTVRLTFSAAAPAASGDAPAGFPIRIPSRRILIVDDDPLVLASLRDTLETDGHSVTPADGGQAGIDAFLAAQAAGHPFEVVITDLGMPHTDGRKVSAAVKGAAPRTRVLLLTGWGQRLVDEGDIPPHVDRVLAKPAKLRDLREALSQTASSP